MPFSTTDTIVAIATPPGRAGLGVIRLSGPEAATIASALVVRRQPFVPRYATFCRLVDASEPENADAITSDRVVVTFFPSPHSYTGEDVAEISAHGSPLILATIVRRAIAAGARLAEPGEFTLRAFLSGKIDLIQAEAVADLIDAVTPLQARAAFDQLEGTLTRAVCAIEEELFDLTAKLEASLDFPEEGYHFLAREDALAILSRVISSIDALLRQSASGRLLREGAQIAIVGAPNVGKSSLFNALLKVESRDCDGHTRHNEGHVDGARKRRRPLDCAGGHRRSSRLSRCNRTRRRVADVGSSAGRRPASCRDRSFAPDLVRGSRSAAAHRGSPSPCGREQGRSASQCGHPNHLALTTRWW